MLKFSATKDKKEKPHNEVSLAFNRLNQYSYFKKVVKKVVIRMISLAI